MPSIAAIRAKLKQFDTYARSAIKHNDAELRIQHKWDSLFDNTLTATSAKSFINYYRKMTRRQTGGVLSSAPLTYTMTPGLNVATYGRFPVEIDTDPASIQNLDVYYQNSLTRGCGVENSSLTIPVEMGTNQVGGRNRKSRKSRKNRKSIKNRKASRVQRKKSKVNRKSNRKTTRKNRRQRGGDLLASIQSRPFAGSAPPNLFQITDNSLSGATTPVPAPSSPVNHTWNYLSNGTFGLINPGAVTSINDDLVKLASPPPWQTSN